MSPVAPRIVNDVSYVSREPFCMAGAVFGLLRALQSRESFCVAGAIFDDVGG